MQKVAHCQKALSYFAHVLLLSAAQVRVPTSPTGRLSSAYFWAVRLQPDWALVLLFRGRLICKFLTLKVMSIFGLGIQELPQLLELACLVSWLVLAAEVQWEGTHNRALSCPDAVRRSLDLLLLGHEASWWIVVAWCLFLLQMHPQCKAPASLALVQMLRLEGRVHCVSQYNWVGLLQHLRLC